MLLEAFIEQGRLLKGDATYRESGVRWVLHLTSAGKFKHLERLAKSRTVLLPYTKRTSECFPSTGIDSFVYALGSGRVGNRIEFGRQRHLAYRKVLGMIDHPAARLIEKFLNDPERPMFSAVVFDLDAEAKRLPDTSPDSLRNLILTARLENGEVPKKFDPSPATLGLLACAVAGARASHPTEQGEMYLCAAGHSDMVLIEIDGHPEWWLSPEVRALHTKRILAKDRNEDIEDTESTTAPAERVFGQCSFCFERKELQRCFPALPRIASLISFNGSAWTGWGQDKGYNAPTCRDCVTTLTLGATAILSKNSLTQTRAHSTRVVSWWPNDIDQNAHPLELIRTFQDADLSDEEREQALAEFPEGHFASFVVNKVRTGLHRYGQVSGAKVARNLRIWRKHCGNIPPMLMAEQLTHSAKATDENQDEVMQHFTEILMLLSGVREVGAADLMLISMAIVSDSRLGNRLKYWRFLHELHNPEGNMTPNDRWTPNFKHNFFMGKAFAACHYRHYAQELSKKRARNDRSDVFTLMDSHGTSAASSSVVRITVMTPYMQSKAVSPLISAAGDALDGAPDPLFFNAIEQVYFFHGFAQHLTELRAAAAARWEEHKAAAAAAGTPEGNEEELLIESIIETTGGEVPEVAPRYAHINADNSITFTESN